MGVALGHVAGALLVAHEDVADAAVEQRVVGRQDAAAGQAEHDLGALHLQRFDQGLGPGDLHGVAPLVALARTCPKTETASRLGGQGRTRMWTCV